MSIPRILVQVGTSLDNLSPLIVNSSKPNQIESDFIKGTIKVRLQPHFTGKQDEEYFNKRSDVTWSIQFTGTFLGGDYDANEIMFGNIWLKPIRDSLPFGTNLGLKFIKVLDPSLSYDLYSNQPHAQSPLMATMNYITTAKQSADTEVNVNATSAPTFTDPIKDDVTSLLKANGIHHPQQLANDAAARKKYFANEANRKAIKIKSDDIISCDFCNGYIDFNTLSLKLPIGFSIGLKEHWDGQPITFICQTRDRKTTFFVITFQIGSDDDDDTTEAGETDGVNSIVDKTDKIAIGSTESGSSGETNATEEEGGVKDDLGVD